MRNGEAEYRFDKGIYRSRYLEEEDIISWLPFDRREPTPTEP